MSLTRFRETESDGSAASSLDGKRSLLDESVVLFRQGVELVAPDQGVGLREFRLDSLKDLNRALTMDSSRAPRVRRRG